jgi:prephenate dehydratase
MAVVQIGYLGSDCSFTCRAAKRFFHQYNFGSNGNHDFSSFSSCKAIFQKVSSGELAYGVVPVESSNHGRFSFGSLFLNFFLGTISGAYDQMLKFSGQVKPIAETIEMEKFCLSMSTSSSEDTLQRVFSHPTILEDSSDYLDALDQKRIAQGLPIIERLPATDSAAACKMIGATSNSDAVVCCREAAECYNLKIVASSIGNDQNSETRYLIVAKFTNAYVDPLRIGLSPTSPQRLENVKATIALSLKNISSAMFRMTSCFALRDINVYKVETRPSSTAIGLDGISSSCTRFQHWDLIFFIDYQPSEQESVNEALLRNLEEFSMWVKPLGVYRQYGQRLTATEPSEWSNMVDILATA